MHRGLVIWGLELFSAMLEGLVRFILRSLDLQIKHKTY
jgi:hypothetical protein